jgi:hypothetical protein
VLPRGATAIAVSRDEAERLRFWSGRKNAFPASGRISPDYMCMDSTIPRKRLADILLAISEMEKKYQLRCANVFHAGDGNLHPLILFDANDPDQLHRCELFGADILETSVAMGGTVTGEHGVGVEKLNSMCVQFSPEEREQMLASRRLRPARPAQPGQGDPELHRCAEYGKELVRGGRLKHPSCRALSEARAQAAVGAMPAARKASLRRTRRVLSTTTGLDTPMSIQKSTSKPRLSAPNSANCAIGAGAASTLPTGAGLRLQQVDHLLWSGSRETASVTLRRTWLLV